MGSIAKQQASIAQHALRELTPIAVTQLTTQQAADLLNVSRPLLVKLLEAGEIAFESVGTHRRVTYANVLAYKTRDDQKRAETVDELTAKAERLGLR